MTLDPKIFREYDIRGVAGHNITPDVAYDIGRAFGTEILTVEGKTVCVGCDGRLSSPVLVEAVIKGFQTTGVDVTQIDIGPTPLVHFATHHLKQDAGLMVTGSHNPADQNGFKMTLQGKPFWGDQVRALETRINAQDFAQGQGTYQRLSMLEAYVSYLAQDFITHYGSTRTLKVAWDPGNGAAGEVVAQLVKRLPGTHIVINEAIDGTFPSHHPDPTVAKNLVQLQQVVLGNGCDLGVAFDGDGDRLGAVDGQGHILWADEFLELFAEEVLETHPGATIIADVKASQGFFEAVARIGGQPLMWKTGHALIKSKMAQVKAPLAGELSGHIFFADRYFGYDDGVYAALRLIGICAAMDTSLANWYIARPPRHNTPEMRIDCDNKDKFQIVKNVSTKVQSLGLQVDLTDGVRVVMPYGWWLLRASNTQDVLVARAEAISDEALHQLVASLKNYLKEEEVTLNDI